MAPKTLNAVLAVLVALLVVTSSLGAYYYYETGQETSSKNQYIGELNAANGEYSKVATEYNSVLSLYNQTLSLLARTVTGLNTSETIYVQASKELPQLWDSYLKLKPASSSLLRANVLFYFGNGSERWYNNTAVQPGWNMFTLTVVLTGGNLQAQVYDIPGSGQEHFVSAIDGVSNSESSGEYWYLWTHNSTGWSVASVGADLLPVYNGSLFAWTFCKSNVDYEPTCTP